jgi:hypothetical protein
VLQVRRAHHRVTLHDVTPTPAKKPIPLGLGIGLHGFEKHEVVDKLTVSQVVGVASSGKARF